MTSRRRRLGNPLTAIAYLRVSTDDQALGVQAQRAAITAWAARQGVSVTSWHVDEGVSGGAALEDRKALLEALAALPEAGAGVLVVAKRDRLARDVGLALAVEKTVTASGARIVAADGAGNGDAPADRLMRTILDGAAEFERAMIRARTKAALGVKKARGERVSRHVPYGFTLAADGVHLEPLAAEQATLATIRKLHASGLSTRRIVAELEDRGIVGRTGQPLGQTQVFRVVRAA